MSNPITELVLQTEAILRLAVAAARPIKSADVVAATGLDAGNARRDLRRMAEAGLLSVDGEGARGVVYYCPTAGAHDAVEALDRAAQAGPATGFPVWPLDQLRPNPDQPRKSFPGDMIADRAESIVQVGGLLQPLVVEPADASGARMIQDGECRWRAAQLLAEQGRLPEALQGGLPFVERAAGEAEMLTVALIANAQRSDLSPWEDALGLKRLKDLLGLSARGVALKLGRAKEGSERGVGDVQQKIRTAELATADNIALHEAGKLSWEGLRESVREARALSPHAALAMAELRWKVEEAGRHSEDDVWTCWVLTDGQGPRWASHRELVEAGLIEDQAKIAAGILSPMVRITEAGAAWMNKACPASATQLASGTDQDALDYLRSGWGQMEGQGATPDMAEGYLTPWLNALALQDQLERRRKGLPAIEPEQVDLEEAIAAAPKPSAGRKPIPPEFLLILAEAVDRYMTGKGCHRALTRTIQMTDNYPNSLDRDLRRTDTGMLQFESIGGGQVNTYLTLTPNAVVVVADLGHDPINVARGLLNMPRASAEDLNAGRYATSWLRWPGKVAQGAETQVTPAAKAAMPEWMAAIQATPAEALALVELRARHARNQHVSFGSVRMFHPVPQDFKRKFDRLLYGMNDSTHTPSRHYLSVGTSGREWLEHKGLWSPGIDPEEAIERARAAPGAWRPRALALGEHATDWISFRGMAGKPTSSATVPAAIAAPPILSAKQQMLLAEVADFLSRWPGGEILNPGPHGGGFGLENNGLLKFEGRKGLSAADRIRLTDQGKVVLHQIGCGQLLDQSPSTEADRLAALMNVRSDVVGEAKAEAMVDGEYVTAWLNTMQAQVVARAARERQEKEQRQVSHRDAAADATARLVERLGGIQELSIIRRERKGAAPLHTDPMADLADQAVFEFTHGAPFVAIHLLTAMLFKAQVEGLSSSAVEQAVRVALEERDARRPPTPMNADNVLLTLKAGDLVSNGGASDYRLLARRKGQDSRAFEFDVQRVMNGKDFGTPGWMSLAQIQRLGGHNQLPAQSLNLALDVSEQNPGPQEQPHDQAATATDPDDPDRDAVSEDEYRDWIAAALIAKHSVAPENAAGFAAQVFAGGGVQFGQVTDCWTRNMAAFDAAEWAADHLVDGQPKEPDQAETEEEGNDADAA